MLALYAPFGGNTPTEYLFKNAVYDTDTLALFESSDYDAETFRQGVQVVVNLISDVDQADAMLPLAADLVDRLGKPTVNHPRKIQRTTRDAVADLLQGIPGCRIPQDLAPEGRRRAVRAEAAGDVAVRRRRFWPGRSGPMAATISKRSTDAAELAAYLAQPADHRPLFHRICRLSFGRRLFPEIRFIFVDDQILPYHLAIGRDWKVHHVNTDMANQPWMQQEEAAFLNDPAAVFDAGA